MTACYIRLDWIAYKLKMNSMIVLYNSINNILTNNNRPSDDMVTLDWIAYKDAQHV
jgi:hypothetical protein